MSTVVLNYCKKEKEKTSQLSIYSKIKEKRIYFKIGDTLRSSQWIFVRDLSWQMSGSRGGKQDTEWRGRKCHGA